MSSLREEEMSILSEEESDSAPVVTTRRKWVAVAAVLAVGLVAFAGTHMGASGSPIVSAHSGEDSTMLFLKKKKSTTEAPQVDEETQQQSASEDASASESSTASEDVETSEKEDETKAQEALNKNKDAAKAILTNAEGEGDEASEAAEDKASEGAAEAELDLDIDSPQNAQDQLDTLMKTAKSAGGASAAVAASAFDGKPMAPKDTAAWLKTQGEQHKKVSAAAQELAEKAAKDSLANAKAFAAANDKMVKETSSCLEESSKCVRGCKAHTDCLSTCTKAQQKCADSAAGATDE